MQTVCKSSMASAFCEMQHYNASGSKDAGLSAAPPSQFQNLLSRCLKRIRKSFLLHRECPRGELLRETNVPRASSRALRSWCAPSAPWKTTASFLRFPYRAYFKNKVLLSLTLCKENKLSSHAVLKGLLYFYMCFLFIYRKLPLNSPGSGIVCWGCFRKSFIREKHLY